MGLRVKICGITKVQQGQAIAELGATALGFICASQSPRYVSPEQIGAIVAGLPVDPETGSVRCDRIGVFVDASLEEICRTVAIGKLNGVQLHGNERPEFCQQLRAMLPDVEIIKALRIRSLEALHETKQYQNFVHSLLLDAYDPKLAGGTGKTLDWSALKEFRPPVPWFLAGGLTPDNVLIALAQLSPDGIDLSSGVELAPGDKDLNRVAYLFETLNSSALQHKEAES